MRNLIKLTTHMLVLTFMLASTVSNAGKFYATQGIAIDGYDPVNYFTEKQATLGLENFSYKWHQVTWHFINRLHLELFKKSPEKYVPQFGGFCALGAAHNGAVPTDPETFTIHKGKLYLNMAPAVGVTWRLNPDFHIKRATSAWASDDIVFY